MAKQLWFGIPTGHMQWVPAPLVGAESRKVRHVETMEYENGGRNVYRSKPYHLEYDFEFNRPLKGSEELGIFSKFASGYYGDGTCIFADPYHFETNLMSAVWASPGLVEQGWKGIYTGDPTFGDLLGAVTTNLATNPSFEAGSGNVTVRTNLAINPTPAVDLTGWGVGFAGTGGTAASTRVAATVPGVASWAMRQTWSVAPSTNLVYGVYGRSSATDIGVTPGEQVTFSTYGQVSWSGASAAIEVVFWTSAGAFVSATGTQDSAAIAANTWVRKSFTTTIPATAACATVRFYSTGVTPTVGSWIEQTGVMVERAPSVTTYFDGSTAAAGDFTYAWSGVANASTSVQRGTIVADSPTNATPLIRSGSWSNSGTYSLRIINNYFTAASSYAPVRLGGALNNLISTGKLIAGTTYTVIATYRQTAIQSSPVSNARSIYYRAVTGGADIMIAQAANTVGQQTIRGTFTVPGDATNGELRLYHGGAAGTEAWWDDLAVIEGTYTGNYFDGGTTDTAQVVYSWTGTANASTSTAVNRYPENGLPRRMATYTITTAANTPSTGANHKFTVPIPPTHTLWLGASGTRTGTAVVQVRPIFPNGSYGPTSNLTLLSPTGSTRLNASFSGATYQAVEVYLTRTDGSASTITLSSIMAQLWRTGATPTLTGNHIPGEGHSGLEFADDANAESYVYIDPPRKALSTTLVEVGAWR